MARAEDQEFTATAVTGSPFSGTTSDHVAYPFAVHGYFNWRNVAIARAVCDPGAVIMDIGANVGSETVSFSDIAGERGAVYAFEPYPPNLERLRRNAGQTRWRNVTVFSQALSDSAGEVAFSAPAQENSGCGYVRDDSAGDDRATVTVARTTIDALAGELRSPRLMVMDVEGHELAVLRGAERLLARERPVIVLEVLEDLLARAGSSPVMIAEHLGSHGYELYEIGRLGLSPIPSGGRIPRASDWLAVPAGQPFLGRRVGRMLRRCGLLPCTPRLNPLRGGWTAR